jgi:hypothetical protein
MQIIAETMIGLKVPEYLSAGLPVIINERVGGMRSVLRQHQVGVSFDLQNLSGLGRRIRAIRPEQFRTECINVAQSAFDLKTAAQKYYTLYHSMLDCRAPENQGDTCTLAGRISFS